jgi:gas vesicle protein
MKGGRVSEQTQVIAGALIGALVGAAASYLFFTERGRVVRDRIEPVVDDMRREFTRFQKTIEKVGDLANDGMRIVSEFNAARAQSQFPSSGTSH